MGNIQTNNFFWKIDKLNVFSLIPKHFFHNIRPIEKKVMTGFRHGVKGRSQKGVGARGSDPSNVTTFQFEIICVCVCFYLAQNAGKPFWEKGYQFWDTVNQVGLRSHFVASHLGAKLMSKKKKGLIINVSSVGGLGYLFDVAYGVGKAAMDRMAQDMAMELFTENIAMVIL